MNNTTAASPITATINSIWEGASGDFNVRTQAHEDGTWTVSVGTGPDNMIVHSNCPTPADYDNSLVAGFIREAMAVIG